MSELTDPPFDTREPNHRLIPSREAIEQELADAEARIKLLKRQLKVSEEYGNLFPAFRAPKESTK